MTMLMIEGFEQISTSIDMSAEQVQYLLLAVYPDEDSGWFGAAGDSVRHNTNGRVEGNCLRFTRGANVSPSWSADTAANLGFSFRPKQKATLGWAVRYSMAPSEPIPLAGFRYDNGSGDQEQISLWATPTGKLYVSTTPYAADYDSLTIGINPMAVTAAGAFRFTQWTYFEFVVNYSGETPSISVLVNGEIVLDGIESETFIQLADDPYLSSAHIFNPTNSHFNNESFWQSVDDIYIDDANTHGPQWVVGLENGAVTTNTGWDGVPSDVYPGVSVQGDDWGDSVTWELSNFPAGVGTITAIGVNLIASQAATIDAVTFGVANASSGGQRTKRGSISAGDPDRCLRFCSQTAPTSLSMTAASLNNMRGYLQASEVVV